MLKCNFSEFLHFGLGTTEAVLFTFLLVKQYLSKTKKDFGSSYFNTKTKKTLFYTV